MENLKRITLFARKCDCCGKGMDDGYYLDGEYICSDECFDKTYTSEERTAMDVGGDDSDCYWTEWNDESDISYQEINGVLTSINDEE